MKQRKENRRERKGKGGKEKERKIGNEKRETNNPGFWRVTGGKESKRGREGKGEKETVRGIGKERKETDKERLTETVER